MCAGGEPRIGLTTLFVHVQIGDGTTTHRYSPVSVVGLSSGVAMVALGCVSFVYDSIMADFSFATELPSVLFIVFLFI